MHSDEQHSTPGSIRELMQVALPLILSSGSLSLMMVVDRIFLTWYSSDALAAAMPAGLVHWTVVSIAMGMAIYVNTFVAQYDGAQQKERVAASIWQGIYLALFTGLLILLFIPLAAPIFRLIGHAESLQPLEADYFSILCFGSTTMILSTVLSCFYTGRGKTVTVMWVNLVASLVNIVFDYVLIFGSGPFPEWGIRGAAIATVAANSISAVLYAALLLRPPVTVLYGIWQNRGFDRQLFARLIRYGLPNGIQFLADFAGFTLFILLVGRIGTAQLAATNLAFNLNTLAFVPMLGMGTAVSTLVGKRIGEGKPQLAVRTTWLAFAISGIYMILFAFIYLFLPDLILTPYAAYTEAAEFESIRNQVIQLLRFVALYSFFDAMVIVFGNAIRGAGDTRYSLWFSFIAGWSIMVIPTAIILFYFDGNLMLCWSACTAYIVVLGVGYLLRFLAGRWQSMRVIEEKADLELATSDIEPSSATETCSPA